MTEPPTLPDKLTDDDDEISLLDLLIVVAKRKKLILGLPIAIAAIAAAISFLMPDIYTATTKILPPQQSQSSGAAGLLAQLGSVAGGLGNIGFGGGASSMTVYVAMLKSRTVSDKLIERFGRLKPGDAKGSTQERNGLSGVATIAPGKDGLLTIDVDDTDPERAADLANAYVEELVNFTQVLAVTEASQRRLFFERQLVLAKDNLASAEASLKQALERGGIAKVDDQASAMANAIASLRGQITGKEVQIGAMRTFAAERNPELNKAQAEIESMKRELAKLEGLNGPQKASSGHGGEGVESVRLMREFKYREVVFDMLSKQYELAKIDEAKDNSVIQVMDRAIPPKSPSKPRRVLIVILSGLVALFLGVLSAFVLEAIAKTSSDPRQSTRLESLKRYLAWR